MKTMTNITLNIHDQTATTSPHGLYMVGYSVASRLSLAASGRFTDDSNATSIVPVDVKDVSTITLDTDIRGGRIYFFVTPLDSPPPAFTINEQGGVVQPSNPPNNALPYSIVELTMLGGALTIDVQTVDGFIFPLTLTLFDADNTQIGPVGQPLGRDGQANPVNRAAIFEAYTTFMKGQGAAGVDYLPLVYGKFDDQAGGIVNPGLYLADGANPDSPLNTVWDNTLDQLFMKTRLSVVGDDGRVYQGAPTTVGEYHVLQFVNTASGNQYNIYDPRKSRPDTPNKNFSAGAMVFANNGAFADSTASSVVVKGPAKVALGLERDLVAALNRGIATSGPRGTNGETSAYWATESNWYPASTTQNLFSLFMHTAVVADGTPIFIRPPRPVRTPTGAVMGQAYGFAYDEDPTHATPGQPPVPSKFDPVPAQTRSIDVTLGPWTAAARSRRPRG